MKGSRLFCLILIAWVSIVPGYAISPRFLEPAPENEEFSFIVAADIRDFTGPAHPGPKYFEGACAAMCQTGPGAFLIATGDIDPPAPLRATLDRFMGTNYPWHPVVGNHDKAKKRS